MNTRDLIDSIPKIQKNICCIRDTIKELGDSVKAIDIVRFEYDQDREILEIDFKLSDGSIKTETTSLKSNKFKPNIVVDNYNDLTNISGQSLYEFAQVINSQGTKWLPGSFGGTYYSSGLYYWNGSEWVNDLEGIQKVIYDILNTKHYSTIQNSGRFYMDKAGNWRTPYSPNYGAGYYQFATSGGTRDTEPYYSLDSLCPILYKDTVLEKFTIGGRFTNREIEGFKIIIVLMKPNNIDSLRDGYTMTELYRSDILVQEGVKGFWKHIDLGNHIVTEDSYFNFYIRPIGSLTKRRYFTSTFSLKTY